MVKLSKKERGFVRDYVKTGNGTKSVLNNYDTESEHVAGVMAVENLGKPRIQQAIAERIPDDLLVEKHHALLNKLEVKRTFNQEIGEWIEIETGQIDTIAVSKGLDMAYKIKGSYAPEKTMNVNIEIEATDEIKKLADELNAIHARTNISGNGVISSAMGQEA